MKNFCFAIVDVHSRKA